MRNLILFRGAAGCGKSTFIKQHKLENYVVSPDELRIQLAGIETLPNGKKGISMRKDKLVWNMAFEMLETRMENGLFTVFDATNASGRNFSRFKSFADKYRYKIYLVDMTDIPIDVCKLRNSKREEYKRVPDYVIDKMYAQIKSEKVPSGIKVISPKEFTDIVRFDKIDLDDCEKIHIIGDIHGCYTAFSEFYNKYKDSDDCFIFLGDYLDRGLESKEMLSFLLENYNNPNMIFLEGNHEAHLKKWANNESTSSEEFNSHTIKDIAEISKKEVRTFCRNLIQCAYFTYGDKTFVCTHAGINHLPDVYTPTREYIKGVGNYKDIDDIDDLFCCSLNKNEIKYYSIHGHRNPNKTNIKVNDACYNLEGDIEHGGSLRVVTLSKNSNKKLVIKTEEYQNTVFRPVDFGKVDLEIPKDNVGKVVEALRSTSLIKEKKFDNISSFNFSRDAFEKSCWTDATIKARGLFINTKTNEIVVRGYEKFFKAEERADTQLNVLKDKLVFPITAFVKENGYLGLLGYNSENDQLFFASKSTFQGPFAVRFKEIFLNSVSTPKRAELKEYLKENNCCLVFEVIDPKNDPHIIEYNKPEVVLLDCIYRTIDFKVTPYDILKCLANQLEVRVKTKAFEIENWNDFSVWCRQVTDYSYKYDNNYIEGFVCTDMNNYLFKVKSEYYDTWKWARSIADSTIKFGKYSKASSIDSEVILGFYNFVKNNIELCRDKDIITMRKLFESNS